MKVLYREAFLKDLKKLQGTHYYDKIKKLVFQVVKVNPKSPPLGYLNSPPLGLSI